MTTSRAPSRERYRANSREFSQKFTAHAFNELAWEFEFVFKQYAMKINLTVEKMIFSFNLIFHSVLINKKQFILTNVFVLSVFYLFL